MFISASHTIDPDGDVDVLLPDQEELSSSVDNAWTQVSPAPGLNYRSWKSDEISIEESQPCEDDIASEAPSEESQLHNEQLPPAIPLSEPEQPCDTDYDCKTDEHDTGPTKDKNCLRIRTSSKHLIFSSSYFKRALQNGMLESQTLRSQGHVEYRMEEQHHEAMLIILNIIHGKNRKVPRIVGLDMLAKLVVIVDYLDCLEVVEPFSDIWVDNLKDNLPTTCSKALIQWLCISLILRKQIQFEAVTRLAVRLSRDAIQTLGLPIREGLVDKINSRRYEALDRLLSALEDLLDDFRCDRIDCTFECNAMRYGALMKELSLRTLLLPRPHIPFLGYSIEDTTASIREIRDPKWCSGNNSHDPWNLRQCQFHNCKISTHIEQIIVSIEVNLKGFSLEDFP